MGTVAHAQVVFLDPVVDPPAAGVGSGDPAVTRWVRRRVRRPAPDHAGGR